MLLFSFIRLPFVLPKTYYHALLINILTVYELMRQMEFAFHSCTDCTCNSNGCEPQQCFPCIHLCYICHHGWLFYSSLFFNMFFLSEVPFDYAFMNLTIGSSLYIWYQSHVFSFWFLQCKSAAPIFLLLFAFAFRYNSRYLTQSLYQIDSMWMNMWSSKFYCHTQICYS